MDSEFGARELRHNLSKYVARVKGGESPVVTERGDEVAGLIPSGPDSNAYADLTTRFDAVVPVASLEDVIRPVRDSIPVSGVALRYAAR